MRNYGTWEGLMGARWSVSKDASSEQRATGSTVQDLPRNEGWNAEKFAREQTRGMVRQVFFASGPKPVRQVVFSATEAETDVKSICLRAGECLAFETHESVAVVGRFPQVCQSVAMGPENQRHDYGGSERKRICTRMRSNLWLVPSAGSGEEPGDPTMSSLHSFLCELRREFEYSIVVGPSGDEWNRTAAMGHLADGIILVLSAQRSRRVTARNLKESLERSEARILGTVLSDRDFPIPEGIYRRL
jgi:hypothetical protein